MAGTQPPKRADDASSANMGWTALGYLIAGSGVWGAVGWGIDAYFGLPKSIGLLTGMILGMFGSVYLIVKRMST
jgi:ATP synthase protein I